MDKRQGGMYTLPDASKDFLKVTVNVSAYTLLTTPNCRTAWETAGHTATKTE